MVVLGLKVYSPRARHESWFHQLSPLSPILNVRAPVVVMVAMGPVTGMPELLAVAVAVTILDG